jgi:hypothetical protein
MSTTPVDLSVQNEILKNKLKMYIRLTAMAIETLDDICSTEEPQTGVLLKYKAHDCLVRMSAWERKDD